MLTRDGVTVWADRIIDAGGRSRLDPVLREAAAAGVSIRADPDVSAKMGVKSVLHATRALGWGTDTHRYADLEELRALLLERLASGPRVLKENRSNGGRGVWRVEVADRGGGAQPIVSVLHAARDSVPFKIPLDALIARFAPYFERGECLIDQPFQPRLGDGMIRRSEEHTSELQSLMRISYAVFCLKKKKKLIIIKKTSNNKHEHQKTKIISNNIKTNNKLLHTVQPHREQNKYN